MKCDIELGCTVGEAWRERWWWEIHPQKNGCNIASDRFDFSSRGSALRAARRWAKLLGFTVEKVYKYGEEPD